MKHRIENDPIARNILLTAKQKLPEYRKDVLAHIEETEDISEEESNQRVADIRRRYLDSVYEDIYAQAEKYEDAKTRLQSYRESEDGKNGIMAGKIYAAIYPSLTGKEASPDDCIALNHAQTALMDQVLDEIEYEESCKDTSVTKSTLALQEKKRGEKNKTDGRVEVGIIVISLLLVISLAVIVMIQNYHLIKESQSYYDAYNELSQEYNDVIDFIDNDLELEFVNPNASYYHKYNCPSFHKSKYAYYGSAEDMRAAGYRECRYCH